MPTAQIAETRLEVPKPEHIQEVIAQTQREQAWYEGARRFADTEQLMGAVAAGSLVRVVQDSNTAPIYRLRTPGMEQEKPPFLLPTSREALAAVGRMWREELGDQGIVLPDLRLAVTSLARTEQAQQALIDDGAVAAPGSTHCVGAAFDIDASGYYRADLDNGPIPITSPLRDRAAMREIEQQLMQRYQNNDKPTAFADASAFDSRVMTALLVVAQELHEGDYLNRIVEHPGAGGQCLHMCPNPEVTVPEWRSLGATNSAVWMG